MKDFNARCENVKLLEEKNKAKFSLQWHIRHGFQRHDVESTGNKSKKIDK